jgi:hypothetical protein
MKFTRLYTGDDDQSHFEDINIILSVQGDIGDLSNPENATSIIFRETSESYDYDWHTSPTRQYVIMLDGEVEIEIGDGSKRIFRTGDILLAEDTDGQGHISRAVQGRARKSIFITLD